MISVFIVCVREHKYLCERIQTFCENMQRKQKLEKQASFPSYIFPPPCPIRGSIVIMLKLVIQQVVTLNIVQSAAYPIRLSQPTVYPGFKKKFY